jgi:hypothetical protein
MRTRLPAASVLVVSLLAAHTGAAAPSSGKIAPWVLAHTANGA